MPVTPGPLDDSMILWALDLDEQGNPILAHRIVDRKMTKGQGVIAEEYRVTACGLHLDAQNHPTGWWQLPPGEVPLAEISHVHCGLLMPAEQATVLDHPLLNQIPPIPPRGGTDT